MKTITLLATLFLASFTDVRTIWHTNFQEARSEATQRNQFILLNFSGSDWCAPCIRLKTEFFASGTFIDYASANLVLANADFPRLKKNQLDKKQVQHNEALAEKYNPEGKFPFTILLNASGQQIKVWDGLPQNSPDQFVAEIQKAVAAAN